MSGSRPFGEGTLSRLTAAVYTLVVVQLLWLLTTAPGLVVLVLLGRTTSNLPLVAACALPVGPALSAALFTLRQSRADLADLQPARAFWRGYRLNVWQTLRIWVPWLAGVTVIAMTVAHLDAAGVPRWWGIVLIVVAVAATLWVLNAIVITSLFAFRTVDIARLSVYFLFRTPKVTIATFCLVVVAFGITTLATEAALALLASVLALLLLLAGRPMIEQTREQFVA